MVAYLEKSDENAEFHQIVDFLSTCSINYALTVSPTIYASYIEQFWNTATSKTVNSVRQIHAIVDGKAVVISESSVRSDLLFNDEDGITCLTNDENFKNLALMGYEQLSTKLTFQKGLERVLKLPNEPPLLEDHTSRSGEGRMEYTFELMDIVPPTPYESPLLEGYTPRSDEGRLELEELMAMCIKLSKQVLDLEKDKDAQAVEILKLKKRVESSDNDLDEEDASKQERYSDKTKPMFKDTDFDVLDDVIEDVDVSTARPEVSAASVPMNVSVATLVTPPTITTVFDNDEDLTIAQTLVKMRSEKAKEKGVAFRDVEETPRLTTTRSTTTLQPLPTIDPKDKAKGVLVEEEPEKPKTVKRRDQGLKQEEATNAALAEEFDEIQARMDADHELAVRLTHEEQEKYTIEERARLLAEFFERRKKQLAAEREEAIRNKLSTRAQFRNRMITYLKHIGKYTHQQLKHKTLEELQKLYKKEQKWINDFKPMDSEEDGSNIKKAGKRIKRVASSTSKQKLPKKPKVIKEKESSESDEEAASDYEQEKEELRMWLTVVPDEDETMDLEILSAKYPIVDWKS
ncbi:hypothetical protein Tco_1353956 [Tanacetum coccineum]